jgi:hypothetical protein
MFHGSRFSAVAGVAVAFGIALAPASVSAQSADWRALRIDGSTPESLQASVASLQNVLSASARDDFETALAAIWLGNTTTGDIDKDGFFEFGDVSELRQYSEELLADIHRGDLVVAIEKLDVSGDDYSTADYFEQLDGLRQNSSNSCYENRTELSRGQTLKLSATQRRGDVGCARSPSPQLALRFFGHQHSRSRSALTIGSCDVGFVAHLLSCATCLLLASSSLHGD